MSRSALAPACLGLWLLAAAAPALAQTGAELPRRTIGLHRHDGWLAASVGLQDLFGAEQRQRLTSGFATRVLIRVYLHREGSPDPVAVSVQRSEIVYDIWDERFRVRITRGTGVELHREVKTAQEAIDHAGALWQFPAAELRRLQPGARYFLAFRADLNPISEELLTDVRRWLVQPARGQRRAGAGDTVFGSFVSIFVNPRIEDSERQLRFLSQTFVERPPEPAR